MGAHKNGGNFFAVLMMQSEQERPQSSGKIVLTSSSNRSSKSKVAGEKIQQPSVRSIEEAERHDSKDKLPEGSRKLEKEVNRATKGEYEKYTTFSIRTPKEVPPVVLRAF